MTDETNEKECDCCGADNLQLNLYRIDYGVNQGKIYHFCDLCFGSRASTAFLHADIDLPLHLTICYVGNEIIKEIRKLKNEKS